MILYSTKIPMKKKFDRDAFLEAVVKWNAGGRYRIAGLEEYVHSYSFCLQDGENSISVITIESELTTAVRVHNENKGGIWNTDLILNEDKNILTICLDRTVQDSTEYLRGFADAPRIVRQLIANGFTENNLSFPISGYAARLTSEGKSTMDAVICGKAVFSLPIVYLSSRSKLDPDKLADKLIGLATVVSDENDMISDAYPEPIYIFYPHKNLKPQAFGEYPRHREISYEIVEYLNNQMYEGIETWNGVKNALLYIESQQYSKKYQDAVAENEVMSELQDDYLKQEQENKEERERLIKENQRLQMDVFNLTRQIEKLASGQHPILNMGKEKDMYPDEHLEIIIECLEDIKSKSIEKGSRRYDVLQSIIDANPVKGLPEKYRQMIKKAFEGYTDFSCKKIQDALEETGIKIISHTGHYKIALGGDVRYTYEAAATPSDFRSGINCSSGINKLMF